MYKLRDVRSVHLEITSRCNASCPMCLRNVSGGKVNPQLPLTELSLQDIQVIFPQDFVRQLDKIYYCGNYGDPAVAQDTLATLRYFKSTQPGIQLSLFSNGSVRPPAWWVELATLTKEVHFAIDGLKDTNSIYRRGTQFDVIMKNARSFINAGGRAIWDYIVFRHNEHQIEEAQELAAEMGFAKFNIKKTGRFFSNTRSEVKEQQAVLNTNGDIEYYLEMPINQKYVNSALKKEEALIEKYGHLENYLDKACVDCKVLHENSIYVSAEGYVFPCCWTANQMYPWYFSPRSTQIWSLIEKLPSKELSISAKYRSLGVIIEGDFFKAIETSWSSPSIKNGKIKACAKTCGKEFDPFREQFN